MIWIEVFSLNRRIAHGVPLWNWYDVDGHTTSSTPSSNTEYSKAEIGRRRNLRTTNETLRLLSVPETTFAGLFWSSSTNRRGPIHHISR